MIQILSIISSIKLSKQYKEYYLSWLFSFIAVVIFNIVTFNLLYIKLYETDIPRLLRSSVDPRIPALELNLLAYALYTGILVLSIRRLLEPIIPQVSAVAYGMLLGGVFFFLHTILNLTLLGRWTGALVIMETVLGIFQGGIVGIITGSIIQHNRKNTKRSPKTKRK